MLSALKNQALKILSMLSMIGLAACVSSSAAGPLPDAAVDTPLAKTGGTETAVFAGGCFWGVETVFENVKRVTKSVSGYSGRAAATATYEQVSSGPTGHPKSASVTYGASKVTHR